MEQDQGYRTILIVENIVKGNPRVASYTSVRDLLSASSTDIGSPRFNQMGAMYERKESWREIPLRDPLMQQAAWAYLRPMKTEDDSDKRNCIRKFLGDLFSCFGGFFSQIRSCENRSEAGWC
ncbi:hypothetical protein LguiB_007357 [Lonicera macranthoides]